MWIKIPTLSRNVIFCIIASLLYMILSIPEIKDFVGHYIYLSKHDDIESNHRYYLVFIHSILFGCLLYLLLYLYPRHLPMNIGKNIVKLPNLMK